MRSRLVFKVIFVSDWLAGTWMVIPRNFMDPLPMKGMVWF